MDVEGTGRVNSVLLHLKNSSIPHSWNYPVKLLLQSGRQCNKYKAQRDRDTETGDRDRKKERGGSWKKAAAKLWSVENQNIQTVAVREIKFCRKKDEARSVPVHMVTDYIVGKDKWAWQFSCHAVRLLP